MEFLWFVGSLCCCCGYRICRECLGKVEIFNNIWIFISYHNRIDERRQTLKRNLEALCSLEEYVNRTLETTELQTGKKPKKRS